MELVVACGPADFLGTGPGCRSGLLCASGRRGHAPPVPPVPFMPVAVGVLHYMKPFFGVSTACRRRVDGVSEPHVVQFPPFSGGQAAT